MFVKKKLRKMYILSFSTSISSVPGKIEMTELKNVLFLPEILGVEIHFPFELTST